MSKNKITELHPSNLSNKYLNHLVGLIGSLSAKLESDEENASLFFKRGLLRVKLYKRAESSGIAAYMDDHLSDACMDFEEALHFSIQADEIGLIHKACGDAHALSGNHEAAKPHFVLAMRLSPIPPATPPPSTKG